MVCSVPETFDNWLLVLFSLAWYGLIWSNPILRSYQLSPIGSKGIEPMHCTMVSFGQYFNRDRGRGLKWWRAVVPRAVSQCKGLPCDLQTELCWISAAAGGRGRSCKTNGFHQDHGGKFWGCNQTKCTEYVTYRNVVFCGRWEWTSFHVPGSWWGKGMTKSTWNMVINIPK